MTWWPVIVFGWGSGIAGAVLLLAGAVTGRRGLGVAGVVVSAGLCGYLAMNPPPARWLGLFAFLTTCLSAAATWRKARPLAIVLALPLFALLAWLAWAVAEQ